jgi:acetyl-CoA acetyltransferase
MSVIAASRQSTPSPKGRDPRIAGIGCTEFYRRGRSPLSPYGLALTAIINAADDAGIDVKEIDGLVSHSGEPFTTSAIVDGLGLSRFSYGSQPLDLTAGGAPFAVQLAADAVEQGRADVVVVYKALRMGAADRFGRPGGHVVDNRDERIGSGKTVRHEHVYVRSLAGAFSAPYGASVAAQHWALHAQRHMYQYGTTSRQFGMVAKTFRDHAARNPRALYHSGCWIAVWRVTRRSLFS